jgi:ABC-type phosphate transport system substrate-binding protein
MRAPTLFRSTRQVVFSVMACALAIVLLSGAVQRPGGPTYVVIVNVANPTSSLTDAEISKLFLKRKLRWANGKAVVPVDQRSDSPTRTSFSIEILRKKPSAVDNYWQQQIFSAREVPPAEKASDQAVMMFIEANPDAIGYVAATTILSRGVKVIEIIRP